MVAQMKGKKEVISLSTHASSDQSWNCQKQQAQVGAVGRAWLWCCASVQKEIWRRLPWLQVAHHTRALNSQAEGKKDPPPSKVSGQPHHLSWHYSATPPQKTPIGIPHPPAKTPQPQNYSFGMPEPLTTSPCVLIAVYSPRKAAASPF